MELVDAQMVLGLCDRFKCLPSQLDGESADIIRLVLIERMGTKRESEGSPEEQE